VLAVAVATIYAEHHGRYGSLRVQIELRERGQRSGRKRIARLMRAQALCARHKRRYRTTTDSRHGLPISPNLLARRFTVTRPNTAWVTDMTYLWTPQGWLYLAVIIDLFSRRIVGWSMSERIDRKLALDALRMALTQRRPPRGLIHHSDRGSRGRFKRSSQYLDRGNWDDYSKAPLGSIWASRVAVAGTASAGAPGELSAVLGIGCCRSFE
jgi:putative transposase